mmetsp:Transcript_8670/g.1204  ORF Transcript_8670/g.1204 Transcript_8670/m.1204 type:complete len:86 (-) Transcript_8670:1710-1967(-)
MGDLTIDPSKGNVAFGSGLMGWAFTLRQFAKIYSHRFGVNVDKMMGRLWGEWYFDPTVRKWTKNSVTEDGRVLKRGFVSMILEPI